MSDQRAVSASWSAEESFYTVLGVRSNATTQEIRASYRRLIRSVHPDVDGGDAQRAAKLIEAYGVLIDTTARMRYDAHRSAMSAAADQRRRSEAEAREAAARAVWEAQAAAARAAQAEAERAVLQAQARAAASRAAQAEAERLAREAAARATHEISFTFNGLQFRWDGADLSGLRAIRGDDRYIRVIGQRGFFHHGFTVRAPDSGEWVSLPAGLQEGRYRASGKGGYAPFGGPRGDLVVDYFWPGPMRGENVDFHAVRDGRNAWDAGTVRSPITGHTLKVPGGVHEAGMYFRGEGQPGEFGGEAGDLLLHVVYQGKVRRRTTALAATAALAIGKFVAFLFWMAIALVVVFFLVILWRSRS